MTEKTRNTPPRAGAMMESLRGLGYSTATALADIVDNSVSAGAINVYIDFVWDETNGTHSRITVRDDGRGMNDAELESAMRLGDKNPLDKRASNDLGRFGMGLKTASFSQCRRLTVASFQEGGTHCCLRWDLDAIAARPNDGWLLFEGAAQGSEAYLAPLSEMKHGTLVLWEKLDRVVTDGYTVNDFLNLIDDVERRLAMVFHRLLQRQEEGDPRLRLILNGHAIVPWDPFMSGHPAKSWDSPVSSRTTPSGVVEIKCHVLPHKDKLKDKEWEQSAGPEGWMEQQGFYVYRNKRLLLAGGWLGLGQGKGWNKEEAQHLARICLDIPNTADADWKIDIRKSTARPPVSLRPWLTRLAEDTRDRARRVFAFRSVPMPGPGGVAVVQAWRADRSRSGIRYRIDEKHSAVASVLDQAGSFLPLVKAMLRVIEETVPVQRIWLDTAENRETPCTAFSGEPPENVKAVLMTFFNNMVERRDMSPAVAKRMLACMDPFQNYPGLVASLPDGPEQNAV